MFIVLSHSINKHDAIDIADPGSMQDACDIWTSYSAFLTKESLWLSGSASKCIFRWYEVDTVR